MTEQSLTTLLKVPMPIETERLVIRPPQTGDGQALFEAKFESYDALYEWMIWVDRDKKDMRAEIDEDLCRRQQAAFILRENIMLFAFDKETKHFIGASGLHKPDWKQCVFTTGYWVRTSETGKGFATEIASAVAHYALNALDATRLQILHADGNEASRKVIEKVGYHKEGVSRSSHKLPDGRIVDEHYYSLLKGDDLPDMTVNWEGL